MIKCLKYFMCCLYRKRKTGQSRTSLVDPKARPSLVDPKARPSLVDPKARPVTIELTSPLNKIGDYEIIKQIGKGKYGKVYLGIFNKENFAIKQMIRKRGKSAHIKKELEMMRKLSQHPHSTIVKFYDNIRLTESDNLVLEYCPGSELFNEIVKRKYFNESDSKIIMRKLFLALDHLHQIGIMHRDLKPENIIFHTLDEIKIIDFGLACNFNPTNDEIRCLSQVGTAYYMAPEVLKRMYRSSCDEWSLGIILYILLSGSPPFYGDNDKEIITSIEEANLVFEGERWSRVSPIGIELIKELLNSDSLKRITANKCLKHDWFKDISYTINI